MKPYPLLSLNHLTVPVAMKTPPLPLHERETKAPKRTSAALCEGASMSRSSSSVSSPEGSLYRTPAAAAFFVTQAAANSAFLAQQRTRVAMKPRSLGVSGRRERRGGGRRG